MKTEEIVTIFRKALEIGNVIRDPEPYQEAADRLEFLERALEQAVSFAKIARHPNSFMGSAICSRWMVGIEDKLPDLSAWLQEHNVSTVPIGGE